MLMRSRALLSSIMVVSAFFFLSCTSTQSNENDEYFLGNFLPQEFEVFVGNSISEKTGELTPRELESTFYPNGNAVQISYRAGMNTLLLTLLQKDRTVCIDSMKRYIEEYQNGMLTEKNSKKKAYFGSTIMTLEWGMLAPTYKSTKTRLRFEYQLADNGKPYFVIANTSTGETTDDGETVQNGANSPANRIALSPLQCQKFIETYNQDNLQSIVDTLKIEANEFDLETPQPDKGTTEANALF